MSLDDIQNDETISEQWRRAFQCENSSIECDVTSGFRTIDGTCNNLNHPLWGSSGTTHNRLQTADYDDSNDTMYFCPLPCIDKIQTAHEQTKILQIVHYFMSFNIVI